MLGVSLNNLRIPSVEQVSVVCVAPNLKGSGFGTEAEFLVSL